MYYKILEKILIGLHQILDPHVANHYAARASPYYVASADEQFVPRFSHLRHPPATFPACTAVI